MKKLYRVYKPDGSSELWVLTDKEKEIQEDKYRKCKCVLLTKTNK